MLKNWPPSARWRRDAEKTRWRRETFPRSPGRKGARSDALNSSTLSQRNHENIRTAFLAYLALIAAGWISRVDAKPVTFAYQTPTLNSTLPLIVGVDFGFFAAEGLEVKTIFIRGGPTAIAALVGGDVDYTIVAGVPAVRAIAQGAPVTIVSGMQPYMDYTLMGAKGITQVNDLKGKIVGVTGAGGIAEYAAVEGLAKEGACARSRLQNPLRRRQQPGARASSGRRHESTHRHFLSWSASSWSKKAFPCSSTSAT